jgi:hypothetical protein
MSKQSRKSRCVNFILASLLVLIAGFYVVSPSTASAGASRASISPLREALIGPAKAAAAMMQGQHQGVYTCLPSCDANDSRMFVVAGKDLSTFIGSKIEVGLASTAAVLNVDVFDGDSIGPDRSSSGMWDRGNLPLTFTLIADPDGNGSGTNVLTSWAGDSMANDNWTNLAITNATYPSAFSGNGVYSYILKIELVDPSQGNLQSVARNGFKLRTDGAMALLQNQTINIAAAALGSPTPTASNPGEMGRVYPDLFTTTTMARLYNSRYDGTWEFSLVVPLGATRIDIWDGDFDVGGYNLDNKTINEASRDTKDPDTPDGVPPWAVGTSAVADSAKGVGVPADDLNQPLYKRTHLDANAPAGQKYLNGPPGLTYRLVAPNGATFVNSNPSGNSEWERFTISAEAGAQAGVNCDHVVTSIQPGRWRLIIEGLDIHNYVGLHFDVPLAPDIPRIGDFVWEDANADGIQDPDEPGIAGVLVNLLDINGVKIGETFTDINGFYVFNVTSGTYTTQVDASNFAPGGPLFGFIATLDYGNQRTESVMTTDVLTYDYGYFAEAVGGGSGSIGNQVWVDTNLNGIFDNGEVGIPNVRVVLINENGDEWEEFTDQFGQYQFTNLPAGTYEVSIDESTLPANMVQTYGPNQTADNHSKYAPYLIELPDGLTDLKADFGFARGQLLCPPSGSTTPGSGGALYWNVTASGDLFVRFTHPRTRNDNAYGTSAAIVGWNKHTFAQLVGSDHTIFRFKNSSGTTVLEFAMDYISTGTGTISGYKSLGATGGDGAMVTGNSAWILNPDSSLAQNLNSFCTSSSNCTVSGVNLFVNSPMTDADYNPVNPVFSTWIWDMYYEMTISKNAFGGNIANFGSVSIVDAHNSPSKDGVNSQTPITCPTNGGGGGGGSCGIEVSGIKGDKKQFIVPLKNTTTTDKFVNGVTLAWPVATNGKLKKIKLGTADIWINAAGSNSPVNIVSSQLISDTNKRKIGKGKTANLVFEFENNADKNTNNYTGRTVTVGNPDCEVSY